MCGIFGIHAQGVDVANLTYFGLFALQHRGQESAGIAVGDGVDVKVRRDMGWVMRVIIALLSLVVSISRRMRSRESF